LLPLLEPAQLPAGAVLCEAGQPLSFVHFPCGGVLSLIRPPRRGPGGIEVGLVGREGMAGLPVFLSSSRSLGRWLVQLPGESLRVRAGDFRAVLDRLGRPSELHGLLLRYTHAFLAQVCQLAACNSLHPVAERLARWLVMLHGRAGSDTFPLTHEFVAAMLGVRRASVTEAALALQGDGLIHYRKGRLTVLDLRGLEGAACGCHRAVEEEIDRVTV
jgi:CRP-like cAMP-binding protein